MGDPEPSSEGLSCLIHSAQTRGQVGGGREDDREEAGTKGF